MLKYDPAKMVERAKGCLANKKEIIEVADKLSQEGFSNIFFIGVGGTIERSDFLKLRGHEFILVPAQTNQPIERDMKMLGHFDKIGDLGQPITSQIARESRSRNLQSFGNFPERLSCRFAKLPHVLSEQNIIHSLTPFRSANFCYRLWITFYIFLGGTATKNINIDLKYIDNFHMVI